MGRTRASARAGRRARRGSLSAACLAAALWFAAAAHAAPELVKLGDFASPTYATAPPSEPGRVYVTERPGRVMLIDGAEVTTFLDLTGITLSSYVERGLLSIAFAPDYATSGRFFVYLTSRPDGDIEIREYTRSAADPDVADPASGRILLSIEHNEAPNHNGGQLQIGPDGKLWLATGDGGGGDDRFGHAQDPESLLGKLIRLDGAPEVVARGLRNPWRFSFAPDGTIVIADVGQNQYEEINVGLAANYGWPCREGAHDYLGGCDGVATADPVVEKTHGGDGFCAIVGGYVVRDPGLRTLLGRYVYGDNCNSQLRSVDLSAPAGDAAIDGLRVARVSSFGEDACGRVLVTSLDGPVYRLVDGAPTPCRDRAPGATPTPTPTAGPSPPAGAIPPPAPAPLPQAPAPDVRPCAVAVRITGRHALARRGYLRVALRTDEPCRVTVRAKRFKTRRARLVPGERTVVKLRRRQRAPRRFTVRIRAVDAAGNVATLKRSIRAPRHPINAKRPRR